LTQYVHKHIDASLSTKQVSNVFYISQSYISILFSKILNMNFKQYTSSLKIALSLHDLLKEEQSIYDVAMKYSFTNVSTYSKNLKLMSMYHLNTIFISLERIVLTNLIKFH